MDWMVITQQKWILLEGKGQRKMRATLRRVFTAEQHTRAACPLRKPQSCPLGQHIGRGHQQWWMWTQSEDVRDAFTPLTLVVVSGESFPSPLPLLTSPSLPPPPFKKILEGENANKLSVKHWIGGCEWMCALGTGEQELAWRKMLARWSGCFWRCGSRLAREDCQAWPGCFRLQLWEQVSHVGEAVYIWCGTVYTWRKLQSKVFFLKLMCLHF